MNIDILFIHPGNHKKVYQHLAKEFTAIAAPVWTPLLANYIRDRGFTTAIYDVNVEGWDIKLLKQLFSKYTTKLVVIMVYGHNPSASTQTMPSAIKIAKDIKDYNKDIPIAMGGIHPSALPERTMKDANIDFVIQGEGPYTIYGLIQYMRGKEDMKHIKGLWFKEDGEIKSTSPSPIVENLDQELDGYAWDLLPDLSNYRAHNMHCFQDFEQSKKDDFSDVRSPYISMNTSLGCPYTCSYCCINTIFGKPKIRYWSLEKVALWIDTLVSKYKIKNIRLDDELFILHPKRVEKFCDMLIEREYDLNFLVYGRVDTIQGSLLKKLKKTGINWICLGIESGNEKVRMDVNKNIRKDIKDVVRTIHANDIYVLGNFMFGLPEDNIDTMEETLKLAIDLNCEFANFYTVMAYPGSLLYNLSSNKDGYLPQTWESFSQHGYETQPLPTKYLFPRQVLRFRDEAFNRYFSNSKYINMIDKKFGEKVKKHVDQMLKIKVERRVSNNICQERYKGDKCHGL